MLAIFLIGCGQDVTLKGDEPTGLDEQEEVVDTSMWDGATMQIVSPLSGDFLPYADMSSFEVVIYDAAGAPTDFAEVTWASDVDTVWAPPVGTFFEDDTLDVGTHALTATAVLPNGDRLVYTVGGVLVQSIYTGVYTGTLVTNIAGEYQDTTYEVGCSGAITLVVDAYGETATGDAGCLISLLGYEVDTAYDFELENDDGDLDGAASLDLSFFQYDIDTEGSVTEDGELEGTFATDLGGYGYLDGYYTAERVSRDISEF